MSCSVVHMEITTETATAEDIACVWMVVDRIMNDYPVTRYRLRDSSEPEHR